TTSKSGCPASSSSARYLPARTLKHSRRDVRISATARQAVRSRNSSTRSTAAASPSDAPGWRSSKTTSKPTAAWSSRRPCALTWALIESPQGSHEPAEDDQRLHLVDLRARQLSL